MCTTYLFPFFRRKIIFLYFYLKIKCYENIFKTHNYYSINRDLNDIIGMCTQNHAKGNGTDCDRSAGLQYPYHGT
jgi:hypothetical protein